MSRVSRSLVVYLCLLLGVAALVRFSVPTAAARAGVTIAGSVVDSVLTPIAGITVALERANKIEATTKTDNDGKFTFAGVAPGDYRVRAGDGASAYVRDVRIPGDVSRVQLPIVLSNVRPREVFGEINADRNFAAWSSGRQLSINGGNSSNRNTTIDGVPVGEAGGNGTTYITPNIDSVSEANVVSSGYAPTVAPVPHGREGGGRASDTWSPPNPSGRGDRYAHVKPNTFQSADETPLSTFGADVDTASYANVRRILSMGQFPPPDAVRVEEMVNYFRFDYAEPRDGRPIGLTAEVGDCPWAPAHKLVLIGARAKAQAGREIEGRNIVLLIDVSGSMAPPERLPLIKTALAQFVDTLTPNDRIAIVTYAGSSGLALPSTPARERATIQRAIASLGAGGSTNGASGIVLAYRVAREAYIPGGINRVILATDGDFNVGVTSRHDLVQLIERERDSGIFLSVFGVGSGNLNDAMMEQLADRGNGNYSYLDSLQEARRVLVREGASTLETIAKDVKFQVEFNPAAVAEWKLIGYENRRLAAEDFDNDRKDAGEMGAGHTVTVLYEIVPKFAVPSGGARLPLLTVNVRYKAPDDEESRLMSVPVRPGARVQHLPLAAAIAEFGLLLRDNAHNERAWDALSRRANALEVPRAQIADKDAFADLVGIAAGLSKRR